MSYYTTFQNNVCNLFLIYSESELFETQCLHEVEALLAKALAQEENLLRKKNFLHDRLSILSQRLQQYNS